MIVNETKHQAIILGKTDHSSPFSLKDSLDIFGLNIDNRLRFDNHISTICKKINGQFNIMLRFRKLISKDALLELYKALYIKVSGDIRISLCCFYLGFPYLTKELVIAIFCAVFTFENMYV